jgi:hypothetical protein
MLVLVMHVSVHHHQHDMLAAVHNAPGLHQLLDSVDGLALRHQAHFP